VTEKKDQIINQFNMAGIPSLPELLLREVNTLLRSDAGAQMPVSPDLAEGELQ
jgi:hypothetical protein